MKKTAMYLLILAVISGCNNQEETKAPPAPDEAFSNFISACTGGVISVNSDIRVQFISDIPEAIREAAIRKKVLEFKPAIKGSLSWTNSRNLVFRPDETLEPGSLFTGTLHLDQLMEVPADLGEFTFRFKSMQQSLQVEIHGLNSLDEEDLKWQQLKGTLRTADFASADDFAEVLTGKQNGKHLEIRWTHNEEATVHEFVVDSILRDKSKGQAIISWDGKALRSADKGEEVVPIPALGDFRLMTCRVTQQPEQSVILNFSDPVSRQQDLRGLIYLESGEEIRLEHSGNQVKAYPVQRLKGKETLVVTDAIKNTLDYNLLESYREEVAFTSINPEVELIGDGVILPGTDGWIFPFRAVNLKAVNVRIVQIYENNIAQFFQQNQFDGSNQLKNVGRIVLNREVILSPEKPVDHGAWNVFSIDLSRYIEAEPGAIYNVSLTFDRSQSLLPCATGDGDETGPYREDRETSSFNDPPTSDYWYYWEDYNWSERDDPCTDSYYIYRKQRREAARNVLASDMGIIAKGGEGQDLLVAVTSLQSTEALAGVEVEIYNFQQQRIAGGQTDAKGMVSIALDQKPFLLVARDGKQRGYLRLDDGSALSSSMFDVGGRQNRQGLKGHLYGERGVWRPGDSIYVCFVLEDRNGVLPPGHPVRFELLTPENQLYLSRVRTSGSGGVYDFRTATQADAPTGNWLARVSVGGSTFTRTLKIETVKPNRLKINISFEEDILTGDTPSGLLEARWLHGASGRNLKADIEMDLRSTTTGFKDYPGYLFDDPVKEFEAEEEMIFEGKLDGDGRALFNPGIRVGKEAPGMLQAFFKTRVFENSGEFSVDRYPVLYSPYSSYVGVKIPEGKGWNGALYSDEKNLIPIVTLDAEGNPLDVRNLRIEIFEVRWRWWFDRDDYDNLASYVQNRSRNLVKSATISTVDGKALFELDFGEKTWGRKLIRITNPESGHSTGATFYTDYRGYWESNSQEGPGGAEMLAFSTDKKEYRVGEEITVQLPEAGEGRALISIENGSRILDHFWAEAPFDEVISIEATPGMAPNAYIHITLVQPHEQTRNDRPIRLYGIQPVKVVDQQTILHPSLEMADVLEPEKEVRLKVSEKEGRPMTYTVAVVDEGLLDLTRFATPDLWKEFYAREALGIRTWDLYKYVMGAFRGEMAGLLTIGGDEFVRQEDRKNANRFKPVVKFMGPFELKAGKTANHSFMMPNYVGSVRTMVVASHHGAYGSTEKTSPVKKPLMVLATLPRMVSPSETLTLPVSVFAMDPKIRKVDVEVSTNSLFTLDGDGRQSITFTEMGDQMVNFKLRVAKLTGTGEVEVRVKSGNQQASHRIDLKVRMPNPPISRTTSAVVEGGKDWSAVYEAVGLAGTNTGVLEISSIPPMNLEQRLKYLMDYPHGCVEQTTSAVFPQLYLGRFLELSPEQKDRIQQNITAGIRQLKNFQAGDGGLTYWPGAQRSTDQWGSSYAGHFMLEAESLGYALPPGFIRAWSRYQNRLANSWDPARPDFSYRRSNELNQAYRLYTLALAKKPAMGAMNRMREMRELTPTARWTLAGAYALAGQKEVARQLTARLSTDVESYRELSYTYGSTLRDQAIILEVLTRIGEGSMAARVAEEIAASLSSGSWHSTQGTAFALLAMGKYLGDTEAGEELKFEYSLNGEKNRIGSSAPIYRLELPYEGEKGGSLELTNTRSGKLFLSMHLEGIPLDQPVQDESSDLLMEVRYRDMEGREIDPSLLEQGSDFLAEVTLKHPGIRGPYKEMALTQMFPSGWEIRNLRLDGMESSRNRDIPGYQDIRDDRVYSYFDLGQSNSKTFVVMLNAAYLGAYFLPAVRCEAMYDESIHATISGKWVKVVPQR